jgi:hypothetical protein
MSNIAVGKTLIFLIGILISMILVVLIFEKPQGRVYDCGMADWHPDIPSHVKEECRRLRYEEWKREQDAIQSKKTFRT